MDVFDLGGDLDNCLDPGIFSKDLSLHLEAILELLRFGEICTV